MEKVRSLFRMYVDVHLNTTLSSAKPVVQYRAIKVFASVRAISECQGLEILSRDEKTVRAKLEELE